MESLDWFAPDSHTVLQLPGHTVTVAVEPLYQLSLYYTIAVPGWYSFRFSTGQTHAGVQTTGKVRCECGGVLQFKARNRLFCHIEDIVVAENVLASVVWMGQDSLESWAEALMLCAVASSNPLKTTLDSLVLSDFFTALNRRAEELVLTAVAARAQGALDPTRSS